MSMSLGFRMGMKMSTKMKLAHSFTNWSLLDAYKEEGDGPLRFQKIHLNVAGLTLEDRLAVVDRANEVFHFAYTQAENDYGKRGRYYKVPLLRNFNIDIDDIKIPISKAEYERATAILNGAGRFQRIARAVPYSQLYRDVKGFVESQHFTLEDVAVVGVDRGGRLPSYILREALGKNEGYTLKVDQAGGGSKGELDLETLSRFAEAGLFAGRFVLFVDSTVDSGRQIEVLRRYFDAEEWIARLGHRGWGIVGSNEYGESLYKHRDINWGLNPDESFEDNPLLMGVDYAPGAHTKVVDCPSETSEAIKAALLEVPRGVVLDLSNLETLLQLKRGHFQAEKALRTKAWETTKAASLPKELSVAGPTLQPAPYPESRKILLVIGDGRQQTLREEQATYLAHAIAPVYDLIAGTPEGNPGLMLSASLHARTRSARLYQPTEARHRVSSKEAFGNPIIFHGETKADFREHLVLSSDAVLTLGGGSGTLREVFLSLCAGRPVVLISDYGAVGRYASTAKTLRVHPNLHLVQDLPDAVKTLHGLSK